VSKDYKVMEKLKEVIGRDIDDPNPTRDSLDAFVQIKPLEFEPSTYPYIVIEEVDSVHTGFALGTDRQVDSTIQITVRNHLNGEFDIDGDSELEESNKVLSWLSERLTEVINENQGDWKNASDCVNYMITVNESSIDERNEILQNNIDAELRTVV